MKTEALSALGLTEEQIKSIFSLNEADIEKHKQETIQAKSDLKTSADELLQANEAIKTLKKTNVDNEELQNSVKDYEQKVESLQLEAENTKKGYALKDKLQSSGVKDPDYLIYKHGGADKFAFDKEGNPIGLEETLKPYKEEIPHIFTTGKVQTQYHPDGGEGFKGVNPWVKETFNLTEQGKLFRENPAQAKELAACAGINLV